MSTATETANNSQVLLKNVRIKFNVKRGADQVLTVDVPGATLAEQIKNLEAYAEDAKKNIESLGKFVITETEIEFGADAVFDFGKIFR